jgi:hypothetical protein
MFDLNAEDIKQTEAAGLSAEEVQNQWDVLKRGVPFLKLSRACTAGDGIKILSQLELKESAGTYERKSGSREPTKFVPASGAASRMFEPLLSYYYGGSDQKDREPQDAEVGRFFKELRKFAFFEDLRAVLAAKGLDADGLCRQKQYRKILSGLFEKEGLHYARLPKGLIQFHAYPDHSRTAIEEHLAEAVHYVRDAGGTCRVHFTLSAEHRDAVRSHLQGVLGRYTKDQVRWKVEDSIQKKSTDTIAVDTAGDLFRRKDQRLLFRPGGHGALIQNLNELNGDIVFIKNIDNVTTEARRQETYLYKKALGGYLIRLQDKAFEFLRALEGGGLSETQLRNCFRFVDEELGYGLPADFHAMPPGEKEKNLHGALHRPLRVCGMVKSRGEPGGGPFWVMGGDGRVTRQIVESLQVDMFDPEQKKIFQSATHFNPVDLVCGLRDYRNHPFDLTKFVDSRTWFISEKYQEGRKLKALERPGLWNGAMGFWHTVFVEVPSSTFTPVKTVNDLLRPEHQV